jgi:hypothetical protein
MSAQKTKAASASADDQVFLVDHLTGKIPDANNVCLLPANAISLLGAQTGRVATKRVFVSHDAIVVAGFTLARESGINALIYGGCA